MNFKKLDLLTLLVSLFIFASCQDPSGVGLEIDSNEAINTSIVDTSTIRAYTVKEDTILNNRLTNFPVGFLKDPVFGTTEANMALVFSLPTTRVNFGTNPVLDSAILVLPYGTGFYGDSLNTNYTLEVRQLNENLYRGSFIPAIFNRKSFNAKPTVLGSKTFRYNLKDSISITVINDSRPDSVKKQIPQIRIALDKTFITNNILRADTNVFRSAAAFANYFNGLYVSMNKNGLNNGGLLPIKFFNGTGSSATSVSRLELYYKNTANNVVDTNQVNLSIQEASASSINHVYTGTVVESALASTSRNQEIVYLQGLGGLKTKVEFPFLQSLKNLGNNITINKAELEITNVGSTTAPFLPPPFLRIYRLDLAGRVTSMPDDTNSGDGRAKGLGGFYNSGTKTYSINVTNYIQDLLRGRTIDYGTYISLNSGTSQTSVVSRGVLGGGNNAGPKMKLKIYYTQLN